jgi:apolipoprotein N-acyltransferase
VVALPGETWSGSKKVEGVVTAVVPVDDRPSWYAFLGDWLPAVCWAGIAAGVARGVRRTPRALLGANRPGDGTT